MKTTCKPLADKFKTVWGRFINPLITIGQRHYPHTMRKSRWAKFWSHGNHCRIRWCVRGKVYWSLRRQRFLPFPLALYLVKYRWQGWSYITGVKIEVLLWQTMEQRFIQMNYPYIIHHSLKSWLHATRSKDMRCLEASLQCQQCWNPTPFGPPLL